MYENIRDQISKAYSIRLIKKEAGQAKNRVYRENTSLPPKLSAKFKLNCALKVVAGGVA